MVHSSYTCGGVLSPWSDLNHDIIYSVMMRLGVVEFVSFSGVCKSWRSFALSNKKIFMASKPPMLMSISHKKTFHLQDFEGRKFKTIIPQLVRRRCVGISYGYLILFREKTREFRLVNPITRHEFYFPKVPFMVYNPPEDTVKAILVFSPSVNEWVFVVLVKIILKYEIWFSIVGKEGGAWNNVPNSNRDLIFDLHAFKGKIYTLHINDSLRKHVFELQLDPVPKLALLDIHFLKPVSLISRFMSSDENLYLLEYMSRYMYMVHKLGFHEMICAPCEKTIQEYVIFHSCLKFNVAFKPESWAVPCGRFFDDNKCGKDRLYIADMWYSPHDCFDATLIDNSWTC